MEFLKHVPTIWNETKPLQGKIGEFAVMARRSDKEWYVGGLSNWTERTLDVDFSFLTPGIPYKAYIIEDVPEKNNDTSSTTGDATACKCHTIDVTSQTRMSFKLAEGGCFVMQHLSRSQLYKRQKHSTPGKGANMVQSKIMKVSMYNSRNTN